MNSPDGPFHRSKPFSFLRSEFTHLLDCNRRGTLYNKSKHYSGARASLWKKEEAHHEYTNQKRNGLSKALKRFYGVGDCGFTLMSNVESYYFQIFLTNLAKFSPATAALIGTITTTVDACLSWIYGAIINSVKPGK